MAAMVACVAPAGDEAAGRQAGLQMPTGMTPWGRVVAADVSLDTRDSQSWLCTPWPTSARDSGSRPMAVGRGRSSGARHLGERCAAARKQRSHAPPQAVFYCRLRCAAGGAPPQPCKPRSKASSMHRRRPSTTGRLRTASRTLHAAHTGPCKYAASARRRGRPPSAPCGAAWRAWAASSSTAPAESAHACRRARACAVE